MTVGWQAVHTTNLPVRFKVAGICWGNLHKIQRESAGTSTGVDTDAGASALQAIKLFASGLVVGASLPFARWVDHDLTDCAAQLSRVALQLDQHESSSFSVDITDVEHIFSVFSGVLKDTSSLDTNPAGDRVKVEAMLLLVAEQLLRVFPSVPGDATSSHPVTTVRSALIETCADILSNSAGFAAAMAHVVHGKHIWVLCQNGGSTTEETEAYRARKGEDCGAEEPNSEVVQNSAPQPASKGQRRRSSHRTCSLRSALAQFADADRLLSDLKDTLDHQLPRCSGKEDEVADALFHLQRVLCEAGSVQFWLALLESGRSTRRVREHLARAANWWAEWVVASGKTAGIDNEPAWEALRQRGSVTGNARAAARIAESCGFGELVVRFRDLLLRIAEKTSEFPAEAIEFSDTLQKLGFRNQSLQILAKYRQFSKTEQQEASLSLDRWKICHAYVIASATAATSTSVGGGRAKQQLDNVVKVAIDVAKTADNSKAAIDQLLQIAECEACLAHIHHESGDNQQALLAAASALARCQRLVSYHEQRKPGVLNQAVQDAGSDVELHRWRVLQLYQQTIAHVARLWEHLGNARAARK